MCFRVLLFNNIFYIYLKYVSPDRRAGDDNDDGVEDARVIIVIIINVSTRPCV